MYTSPTSRLLAAAVLITALGVFTGPVLADEQVKGSEIPADAYYGNTLTPNERSGIASEEDVSPNDGKPSVPPPDVQGVIPDAADDTKASGKSKDPATPAPGKKAETEADAILKDSKKQDPVTYKDMDECMSQWGPDTQMTKEEWAASCRTTLQYYPEGGGN